MLNLNLGVLSNTDDADGSDEDAMAGDYYEAKASKKKEKRRQEREAQRQVKADLLSNFFFMLHFMEESSGAFDDMSMFDLFLSHKGRKVSLVLPWGDVLHSYF